MAGQFDYPLQSRRITRLNSTKSLNNNAYILASDAFFESATAVNATAYPTGVSVSSQIGTAIATGSSSVNATALPSGITTASIVGTTTAKGNSTALPNGITSTSQIGTATAYGTTVINGLAVPSGLIVSSQNGTSIASGGATATGTTDALSIVGNPAVTTGDGYVITDGAESSRLIGTALISANSETYPSGISATSVIGTTTTKADSIVMPSGVNSTAQAGTPIITASSVVYMNGVSVDSEIGIAIASGKTSTNSIAYPSGSTIQIYNGVATINGSANVYPIGLIVNSAIGTVNISGGATAKASGKIVVASAGTTSIRGDAKILSSGVQCLSLGGLAIGSVSVQVAVVGTQASNQIGDILVSGGAVSHSHQAELISSVGSVLTFTTATAEALGNTCASTIGTVVAWQFERNIVFVQNNKIKTGFISNNYQKIKTEKSGYSKKIFEIVAHENNIEFVNSAKNKLIFNIAN